jgi:prephenate dehydrogenase
MIGRMRIAIVGFGLIGGSIARALRRPAAMTATSQRPVVTAWSRRADGPRAALADGILDDAPPDLATTLEGAELVVLAAPPLACLELLDELAGPLAPALASGASVTDVASTKRAIVERAERNGLRFVGGHPLAGRETSGYGAAITDLFVDRPWVVCPGARSGEVDLGRVEWLVTACGARPVRLDPARHDALVAAISHVPLVVSVALAESVLRRPEAADALDLAAGGWRGMTRLATGDPEMGAGIGTTNAAEIAIGLRSLRSVLDEWIAALEAATPDAATLAARLGAVRERLVDR